MPRRSVTTTWLEMTAPGDLRLAAHPAPALALVEVARPMPELNRFFYTAIGGDWWWTDRLRWTWAEWMAWLGRPEVRTLVITHDHVPAGYAELDRVPAGDTEIAYFGLLPQWTGRGLGAAALELVVRDAWAHAATRVWLHTCSLDHPRALENYEARGFRVVRTETAERELPDHPPGPWPGAR
jgi:GNAT superfamily N-acetyltransferase